MRTLAVHPWLPRTSQAVTGTLCVAAVALGAPALVALALGLVALSLASPRYSPVALVFRAVAPPPRELEPAAPVRFSQWLAVGALGAALALLAIGAGLVGWLLVGAVAGLALLSGLTGVCVGCEAYRLALARRGGEDDLRAPLGLAGGGPWLVVLTAPGCARCEPVVRALEHLARGREVVRVSLADRPDAARLPVRSVPAAIAVGADGRLRAARSGRLDEADLRAVLAAA